jgi:hypothetical protein
LNTAAGGGAGVGEVSRSSVVIEITAPESS